MPGNFSEELLRLLVVQRKNPSAIGTAGSKNLKNLAKAREVITGKDKKLLKSSNTKFIKGIPGYPCMNMDYIDASLIFTSNKNAPKNIKRYGYGGTKNLTGQSRGQYGMLHRRGYVKENIITMPPGIEKMDGSSHHLVDLAHNLHKLNLTISHDRFKGIKAHPGKQLDNRLTDVHVERIADRLETKEDFMRQAKAHYHPHLTEEFVHINTLSQFGGILKDLSINNPELLTPIYFDHMVNKHAEFLKYATHLAVQFLGHMNSLTNPMVIGGYYILSEKYKTFSRYTRENIESFEGAEGLNMRTGPGRETAISLHKDMPNNFSSWSAKKSSAIFMVKIKKNIYKPEFVNMYFYNDIGDPDVWYDVPLKDSNFLQIQDMVPKTLKKEFAELVGIPESQVQFNYRLTGKQNSNPILDINETRDLIEELMVYEQLYNDEVTEISISFKVWCRVSDYFMPNKFTGLIVPIGDAINITNIDSSTGIITGVVNQNIFNQHTFQQLLVNGARANSQDSMEIDSIDWINDDN